RQGTPRRGALGFLVETDVLAGSRPCALRPRRRRHASAACLSGGVARVALCLALGFVRENSSDALVLLGFLCLGLGSGSLFGYPARLGCGSLACSLLGGFAGKLLLLYAGLLGLAYRARFKDGLALGPAGQHFRIVVRRFCLEPFEESLLCFGCGVAPLVEVLFPIDCQFSPSRLLSLRAVYIRSRAESSSANSAFRPCSRQLLPSGNALSRQIRPPRFSSGHLVPGPAHIYLY